jgi:hypothetical protein
MMRLTCLAPPLLASVCIVAIGCSTTSPQKKTPDPFEADANHDGKLSLDELNTHLVTGIFESRDTNHDKQMTKAEWLVGKDAGQEKLYRDRDANHDGLLTLDEALAYGRKKGMADKFMREADKDKDGALSRAEIAAYYGSKEGAPH